MTDPGNRKADHDATPFTSTSGGTAVPDDLSFAGYRPAGDDESVRGNRTWWDANAAEYHAEHRGDLAGRLVWGPEGLDEAEARLLGDVAGRNVLEVGAGAGDSADWLRAQGARAVATDLSAAMLRTPRSPRTPRTPRPARTPGTTRIIEDAEKPAPRVQCDARALPFAGETFDVVFTAYGAVPFVGDPERLHAEAHRVLRPGGRWVFSVTHPVRWAFPDDPGPGGLTVRRSYFNRTPYIETDGAGRVAYAEHHRTLGDRVRELAAAGFTIEDLVEPEWPRDLRRTWGAWSPMRGRLIPGTAVFVVRK